MCIRDIPCSLPSKWSDGDVDILGIQIPKERNDLTPIHFYYRKLAKIDTMERKISVYLWKNHPD